MKPWWYGWRLPKRGRWHRCYSTLGFYHRDALPFLLSIGEGILALCFHHFSYLPFIPFIIGHTVPMPPSMGAVGSGYPGGLLGPWMGPVFNVKAGPFNAKGDGIADDTMAIKAALVATEAAGLGSTVYFPFGTYNTTGGFLFKRSTKVDGAPGTIVKLTTASGTLFTFGTDTDVNWMPGGVWNIALRGNGGAADTSIGVQIGNGANNVQGLILENLTVRDFGNGLSVTGTGSNFAWTVIKCRIHNNAFTGVSISLGGNAETSSFLNTHIFNNGLGQATGAGISVLAGAGLGLRFFACQIDNNSNGTLGQINVAATATLTLFMDDCHMEQAGQGDSSFIVINTNAATPRSSMCIVTSEFIQNPAAPGSISNIVFTGDATFATCRFTTIAGGATTNTFDVGASQGGVPTSLTTRGCWFSLNSGGTPANGRLVTVSGSPTQTTIDMDGSVFYGWTTANNLNLPAGVIFTHDYFATASGHSAQRTFQRVADRQVTLISGATPAIDASAGDYFTLNVTANIAETIGIPSNPPSGGAAGLGVSQELVIAIRNSSGGALTTPVSFNAGANGFKFNGGVSPANGLQIEVKFRWDSIQAFWYEVTRGVAL